MLIFEYAKLRINTVNTNCLLLSFVFQGSSAWQHLRFLSEQKNVTIAAHIPTLTVNQGRPDTMVDLGGYVIILVETHDKKVKLYGEPRLC